MKALIYTAPRQLELHDVPDPTPISFESLIAIKSVGICGSDLHGYLGHDDRRLPPLILGHEAAGLVVAGNMAGKRVVLNPLVTCELCSFCQSGHSNLCPNRQIISIPPRQGAMAQLVTMPDKNLIEIPSHINDNIAALCEPLAVCWHAVRLAAKSLFKDLKTANCLVIGGAAIGFGCALTLQIWAARNITIAEINPYRRSALKKFNRFEINDPKTQPLVESTYDLIIDAVGSDRTRAHAIAAAKPGSFIIHIGLTNFNSGLDIRKLTLQEITFIGSYTYSKQDFHQTAAAIFTNKYSSLNWYETRPLAEGQRAFKDLIAGRIACPKIILKP